MNAIRWSLVTVCLSLLSACGGGGSPDPEPTTKQSAAYSVALSADVRNWNSYQLDIVDPDNADLLRSISIDHPEHWITTISRTVSADGLTQTQGHEITLLYINDGLVQAVDLRRGASTESRQVSSLTQACRILWAIENDSTGLNTWLAIATAGPDEDCSTSNDEGTALIRSLDAADTVPRQHVFSLEDVVASGRSVTGKLDRLFTVDRLTGRLLQWIPSNDDLQPSTVTGSTGTSSGSYTRWLGLVPGFTGRGIIQIGTGLHRLSWTGAQASLSAELATVPFPQAALATSDASQLHVIAGQSVLAFGGTGGATTVALLDSTKGIVREFLGSAGALWVVQQDMAPASTPSTLTRILKSNGAKSVIRQFDVPAGMPSDIGIRVVGASGNRLVYSLPSDQEDDRPLSLFTITDQAGASPVSLVSRALGIGVRHNPSSQQTPFRETTHVFWCDAGTPSAPVNCTATRFKSYSLVSNASISLGSHLVGQDASNRMDFAGIYNLYGQSTLVSTGRQDPSVGVIGYDLSTTLWQFKPDVANSLTFISGAAFSHSESSSSAGSVSSGAIPSTIVTVTNE